MHHSSRLHPGTGISQKHLATLHASGWPVMQVDMHVHHSACMHQNGQFAKAPD